MVVIFIAWQRARGALCTYPMDNSLPRVVALYGFSTVGKSTLAKLLAEREGYAPLSGGHFVKDRLVAEGFERALITGNSPARDQPHPLAPLGPDGVHLTPREYEIAVFNETPPQRTAELNRAALGRMLEQGQAVVFEGFRWPAQHLMLRRLKARSTVLMAYVESPQVPVPPPTSDKDDLCVGLGFDTRIANDKDQPIEVAYAALRTQMER